MLKIVFHSVCFFLFFELRDEKNNNVICLLKIMASYVPLNSESGQNEREREGGKKREVGLKSKRNSEKGAILGSREGEERSFCEGNRIRRMEIKKREEEQERERRERVMKRK